MRVLILHDDVDADARPDELDVLVQRDEVADALRTLGHVVSAAPCGLDLEKLVHAVNGESPDLVFNLVESIARTGRLIHFAPALLDALAVPYTGAPADAIYTTSNKVLAKRLLRGAGLPTPDWCEAHGSTDVVPGRHLIKSVWEHGSLGLDADALVDATDEAMLRAAIAARRVELGGESFAERYVDGREFNLSVLASEDGPEVLPPAEIDFIDWDTDRPRIVDWRAKWDTDSREYHTTPRRFDFATTDAPLLRELERLALACWHAFGLRGWARVDFRVDAAGKPWILEVNTNPCLSPDAGFAAAVERAGLTLPDAIARIVADASR